MGKPITIPLDQLQRGVTLPVAVYDGKNASLLLLNRGLVLTDSLVRKLHSRGVTMVTVDGDFASQLSGGKVSSDEAPTAKKVARTPPKSNIAAAPKVVEFKPRNVNVPPSPRVVEKVADLQQQHASRLEAIYSVASQAASVSASTLHDITLESVASLADDLDVFVQLAIEPGSDNKCSRHSMRVTQLALSVGAVLGFRKEDLNALGVGCLLHRIGMNDSIRSLVEANRELTPIELVEIQKLPGKTFDILQQVNDVPHLAVQVAYQIYERWNGSGYPRGRSGVQIHALARVASVCDVFVAMTSERPHRPALSLYQAVEQILMQARQGLFDPVAVRGLLQTVSLYPLGSLVVLSDGTMAKVIRTNRDHYDRPVVQLLDAFTGRSTNDTLDLSAITEIQVAEIIESPDDMQQRV